MQPTLDLATATELVDELHRRFPLLVVAGVKPAPTGGDEEDFEAWYKGGLTAGIGLATRLRATLLKDAVDDVGRAGGDGDDDTDSEGDR